MNEQINLENNEIVLNNNVISFIGFQNLATSPYVSIKISTDGLISITPRNEKRNDSFEILQQNNLLCIKDEALYLQFLKRNLNHAKFAFIPNFYYSIIKYPIKNPSMSDSVNFYTEKTKDYLSFTSDSLKSYYFMFGDNIVAEEIYFCPLYLPSKNDENILINNLYGDGICSFSSTIFLRFYSFFFKNEYYEHYSCNDQTYKLIPFENIEKIIAEMKAIRLFLNPEFVIPIEMLSDFIFEFNSLMERNLDCKYFHMWIE